MRGSHPCAVDDLKIDGSDAFSKSDFKILEAGLTSSTLKISVSFERENHLNFERGVDPVLGKGLVHVLMDAYFVGILEMCI